MPTAPPAAFRLVPLGCLLAAATALLLPGCGGDSAATAESTAASRPAQQAQPTGAAARPCPTGVEALVDDLDALRRQLAIGLSYEQYAVKVNELRASYKEIPVERLTLDCLTATATASENALNKYIDATNAWGECLADSSCTTATIEPVLQRKWRTASHFLGAAG